MEAVKRLLVARTILEKAAADFLDTCAALKLVVVPPVGSISNQLELESNVDDILSSVESAILVESRLCESRVMLRKLLNMSTARVPVNKLPAETLSYVFSIIAASSPCDSENNPRDYLLDIPQVCTRWNQVATNTLSLWSHVDINLSRLSVTTALSRARTRLDRCHGVPIHLHLDAGIDKVYQDYLPQLCTVIRSHEGLLNSLVVTRARHNSLVHTLLGFALSCSGSGSLKTLIVSGATETLFRKTLSSLPTGLFQGLTVLDLYSLRGSVCTSISDIADILTNCCSTLHTLRLRCMAISAEILPSQPTIPLPQLRFLEISRVYRVAAPLFLMSMLAPGVHEMEVRLSASYIARDTVNSPVQLLLARSNVVSLSIIDFDEISDQPSLTCLASVPRLRTLQFGGIGLARDLALVLEAITDDQPSQRAPCLQSLCLIDCIISSAAAGVVGRMLRRRKLRNLAFLNCMYPPSFAGPIIGDQESDLSPEDDEDDEDGYLQEMPQTMREWLSERVGRVVMAEPPYDQIHNGVDPFVQKLVKLE
ncbi:hypothetical protein FRC12_010033 [Ceratobasidium sp. 428]|nr:hypothetical protein FRC12_010033 [Ceratobasidium sp. 428]